MGFAALYLSYGWRISIVSGHVFVTLVAIAIKACKPDVVLLRTADLCDRYDVVKFDFTVLQMPATVLTGVDILPPSPLWHDYSAASLAPPAFRGLFAFASTGAKNCPV